MDEQTKQIENQKGLRELERKSHDTWRIYNPLGPEVNYPPQVVNGDFIFYYDGYPNVIKSKQTKDVEFYKVRHFFKAISDFMIGQLIRAKGEEMLANKEKYGIPAFLDKYQENVAVWDKTPKLNDPELLKEVADKVVLGLVEEYGMDLPPQRGNNEPQTGDTRTLHQQILGMFSKRLADEHPAPKEDNGNKE